MKKKKISLLKKKISSDYGKSSLSIKCPIYEMFYLLNVLSMKCPIYEMSLSMKCLYL